MVLFWNKLVVCHVLGGGAEFSIGLNDLIYGLQKVGFSGNLN